MSSEKAGRWPPSRCLALSRACDLTFLPVLVKTGGILKKGTRLSTETWPCLWRPRPPPRPVPVP